MRRHDDTVAEIIPWYANGTATEEERRKVDEHLPSCPACRELLDQARELSAPGMEEGDLAGHPPAAILREMREEPGGVPAETRTRLEAHLADCPACRSAADVAAGIPEAAAGARGTRREGAEAAGAAPWSWLSRTILSPAMAAAYLLILAAGLGWMALQQGPGSRPAAGSQAPDGGGVPGTPHGPGLTGEPGAGRGAEPRLLPGEAVAVLPPAIAAPGEMTFRDAPAGDDGPSLLVDLSDSTDETVHLRLETDIDEEDLADPEAAFEIRLVQEGRGIWSRTVPGTAFSELGAISLLLHPDLLQNAPATRIEILLDRPGDPLDGKPLYVRRIAPRREESPPTP